MDMDIKPAPTDQPTDKPSEEASTPNTQAVSDVTPPDIKDQKEASIGKEEVKTSPTENINEKTQQASQSESPVPKKPKQPRSFMPALAVLMVLVTSGLSFYLGYSLKEPEIKTEYIETQTDNEESSDDTSPSRISTRSVLQDSGSLVTACKLNPEEIVESQQVNFEIEPDNLVSWTGQTYAVQVNENDVEVDDNNSFTVSTANQGDVDVSVTINPPEDEDKTLAYSCFYNFTVN